MLFGDSTGQAVLDEIVGERHIPGQRTRIPTSRGTGGARQHQTTHLDRGNAKARVSATTKAALLGADRAPHRPGALGLDQASGGRPETLSVYLSDWLKIEAVFQAEKGGQKELRDWKI